MPRCARFRCSYRCGPVQILGLQPRRDGEVPAHRLPFGRRRRPMAASSNSRSWSGRPGRRPAFSFSGWHPARLAIQHTRSRRALWRKVRSPRQLQTRAWSPQASIALPHATQGVSCSRTGTRKRRRSAMRKSSGPKRVAGSVVGKAWSHAPAPSEATRRRWALVAASAVASSASRHARSSLRDRSCWRGRSSHGHGSLAAGKRLALSSLQSCQSGQSLDLPSRINAASQAPGPEQRRHASCMGMPRRLPRSTAKTESAMKNPTCGPAPSPLVQRHPSDESVAHSLVKALQGGHMLVWRDRPSRVGNLAKPRAVAEELESHLRIVQSPELIQQRRSIRAALFRALAAESVSTNRRSQKFEVAAGPPLECGEQVLVALSAVKGRRRGHGLRLGSVDPEANAGQFLGEQQAGPRNSRRRPPWRHPSRTRRGPGNPRTPARGVGKLCPRQGLAQGEEERAQRIALLDSSLGRDCLTP